MARTSGAELAQLLLGGFHAMADEVIAELERRGHPGVRPAHEFALRAIDAGADTASALGRRLTVSKQAAAKTIAGLEQLGYVGRTSDPSDARLKRVQVTPRGHELMTVGARLFDEVRDRWAAQIGAAQLAEIERQLVALIGDRREQAQGEAPQRAT
ncbi:MAG TPA: MarR family transcriptional regulator [Conexibacter sp.]|nr:MarR family transcriptional regulator [Conexibacter sp.]